MFTPQCAFSSIFPSSFFLFDFSLDGLTNHNWQHYQSPLKSPKCSSRNSSRKHNNGYTLHLIQHYPNRWLVKNKWINHTCSLQEAWSQGWVQPSQWWGSDAPPQSSFVCDTRGCLTSCPRCCRWAPERETWKWQTEDKKGIIDTFLQVELCH